MNEDTDNDGVSDGKEVELGTDPLNAENSFMLQEASKEIDTVKAFVDISLSGGQVETLHIESVEDDNLFPETMPGYIGKAYNFSVNGLFDEATISFEFDSSLLNNAEFDPVIYYYNEEESALEAMDTSVAGNIASTIVNHFSTYILVDRSVFSSAFSWQDEWESEVNYTGIEIVFLIDDSGSMGPQSANNDPNNERLSVAKTLIDDLPSNCKIGIAEFETNTTLWTSTLTSDKEEAKLYLSETYFQSNGNNTYMYGGLRKTLSLFDSSDEQIMKVVVLLTDGAAHDTSLHNSVVQEYAQSNVRIYSVGLGNSTSYFNSYLQPLSTQTGGEFYLASNASKLGSIYQDIGERIDIETDSDNDGVPDYYEDHLVMFNGVNIVLDKNNPDTDGDGVEDGKEVVIVKEYNADKTKVKVSGKYVLGKDKLN